jgi:hypothetical protein
MGVVREALRWAVQEFRRPVSPRVVNPLRKVEFLRVHDLVDTVLGAVEDLHATQTPHRRALALHRPGEAESNSSGTVRNCVTRQTGAATYAAARGETVPGG